MVHHKEMRLDYCCSLESHMTCHGAKIEERSIRIWRLRATGTSSLGINKRIGKA